MKEVKPKQIVKFRADAGSALVLNWMKDKFPQIDMTSTIRFALINLKVSLESGDVKSLAAAREVMDSLNQIKR